MNLPFSRGRALNFPANVLWPVVLVLAAFALRQFLALFVPLVLPLFILSYPAVFLAALLGGFWPGVLATLLAAALPTTRDLLLGAPLAIKDPAYQFAVAVFLVAGTFISYFAERNRLAERRVRALEDERLLFRSQATLEAALASMSDSVIVANEDQHVTHFNSASRSFLRFPSDADFPRDLKQYVELFEIADPGGAPVPFDQWPTSRALRGEIGTNVELTLRRKDTRESWVGSFNFSPIRDRESRVVSAVASARDITEMKRAMDEVRASETRYRTIFQTSFDPITLTRLNDGKLIDISRTFTEDVGYTREDIRGRSTLDIGLWADPRDRDRMVEILNLHKTCHGFESRMRRKNGELFWATVAASVVELDGESYCIGIIRDISNVRKTETELHLLAYSDPLTGLANRRKLTEEMLRSVNRSTASRAMSAILLVDLDGFKKLNEALGARVGDSILQITAARLMGCAGRSNTVARLSSDEFALLMEELSDDPEQAGRQAGLIAERVLEAVERPIELSGREYLVTCSIGISLFARGSEDVSEVLQQAEIAMAHAQKNGGNTFRHFATALHVQVQARVSIEGELRKAIRAEQFQLFFQPQVDETGLTGAEALLRWKHPQRGVISPGAFIAVAEDSGLIVSLGYWIVAAACRQLAAWADNPATSGINLAVNISPVQLRKPDFADRVIEILESAGADPRRLKLEITESALLDQVEQVISNMKRLQSCGVRFSLDDFGTGYSSLWHLQRLPMGEIKIDSSFTRDMLDDQGSAAIARAILSLGRSMGIPVIAEGVETVAQREYLAKIGCRALQGYLISRPLPLDDFEKFVTAFATTHDSATRPRAAEVQS